MAYKNVPIYIPKIKDLIFYLFIFFQPLSSSLFIYIIMKYDNTQQRTNDNINIAVHTQSRTHIFIIRLSIIFTYNIVCYMNTNTPYTITYTRAQIIR